MPPNPPSTPPPPGQEARTTFADLIRAGDKITVASACRLKMPQGRMDADVVVLTRDALPIKLSAVLIVLPAEGSQPPRIAHALPVTPALSVALGQVPPSPSTSFFAQSSKPRIEVSLTGTPVNVSGPPVQQKIELQFPALDTLRVHSLVKEIRKAISSSYYSASSHGWLAYYPVTPVHPGSPTSTASSTPSSTTPSNDTSEVASTVESKAEEKVDEDEQFPNPYVEGFSRQGFLRKRLFSRQEKWSTRHPVSLRIVTYNVNDRIPPAGTKELAPILGYGAEDILVVGLQEADLRSQSLLLSQGDDRAAAWEVAIFDGLREKGDEYEKVAMMQYVGVILLVFVKTVVRPHVRMVQGAARGIGIWGIGGNKAGVALRMKVFDTTICFVNSHLAAFASQISRRRLDYQALRSTLSFPLMNGLHPPTEAYYPDDGQLTVDDSDVLFWFGDLNYRVELENKEILALLESNQYDTLISADQLTADIADGLSFADFSESRITFKPSYKYVHGSVTLDPKRAPAYCDRVLYIAKNNEVVPNRYACHDILWSDHLPVTATFTLNARVVDEAKRSDELLTCQGELDHLDEVYRPSLAVDVEDVDFGDVLYRREVVREVTLKNTGRVPAAYSFRAPAPGKPISMPWYWPFPAAGTVQAGEEVVLHLTACVDETLSAGLTGGGEMNDVLVLQVQGGKDMFITVRGAFVPTIVGLPLDVLPDLPDVIRTIPLEVRKTIHDPVDWGAEAEAEAEAKWEQEVPSDTLKVVELMSPTATTFGGAASLAVTGEPNVGATEGPSVEGNGGSPAPPLQAQEETEAEVEANKCADEEHAAALASMALDGTPAASSVKSTVTPAKSPAPIITTTPPPASASATSTAPSSSLPSAGVAGGRPKAKRSRASAITKPPREVWRLLEALMEQGMAVEKLWTADVDYPSTLAVIDALDTGSDLPSNIHAIAAALLHILYALPEPLVPKSQTWRCRLAMTRDDAYTVVEKVPSVHSNVLIGLMSVVRLCSGGEVDKDSVLALATAIFGGPVAYREGLVLGLLQG